jgi:predicted phosphate transport protein (TIGR00153 family)
VFRILPAERAFFDLFERSAGLAHQVAKELVDLLASFDDLPERAKRIHDMEHAGDEVTHELVDRLNRTFITPIDREDIHVLAGRLDDIVDLVDSAVSRIVLYKIREPIEDARLLAACLFHATRLIVEMMPSLRSPKRALHIRQQCRDVHAQESEADRIEYHALAALFEGGNEPLFVMKWKNVIEELEAATDRCEDVANTVESIVLKNA